MTSSKPAASTFFSVSAMRAGDVLVHHPYESFEDSVEHFIAAAADDPETVAVKMTAYRVGDDTPFVKSLVPRGAGTESPATWMPLATCARVIGEEEDCKAICRCSVNSLLVGKSDARGSHSGCQEHCS